MKGARSDNRPLRPNPLVVPLMRRLVLPFLCLRHRLRATGTGVVRRLKPPYVVIANHVNFWDPFWINAFVPHPIQFVTSDNIFRTFPFGFAMRLFGSIPKTKLMTDSGTIRHVVCVLRAGGVIGIFPEGARSYDGRSQEPIETVARLVRMLRIPVVRVRIRGGYLAKPRWARAARRGAVTLEYALLFSGEDFARLSPQEVLKEMNSAISVDEMAWQSVKRERFNGGKPAEYLERLLFVCPHCRSTSSHVSRGRRFTCTTCGHGVVVDDFGFFRPLRGPLYFRDPAEWNAWQLPVFRSLLAQSLASRRPLLREGPAMLLKGYRTRRLQRLMDGTAFLFSDRISFRGRMGSEVGFPLSEVRGTNVQNGEKLEFYYRGVLYRLEFVNPRSSPYKWMRAMQFFAEALKAARESRPRDSAAPA